MRRGESVTVRRLPSGLYAIEGENKPTLVGGAASTALALSHAVFYDEASGDGEIDVNEVVDSLNKIGVESAWPRPTS